MTSPATPRTPAGVDPKALAAVRDLVARAERPVVLTGAGMSAESGVPTFRDAQTGLWERYSPEQLATEEAFLADPALVWSWYLWRARMVRGVEPNAGHRAVAAWQERVPGLTVATQNVDDLHERAGAGSEADLEALLREEPPVCAACGTGRIRPDIVWFGELLPAAEWDATYAALDACDLCVVVGTSGLVQPAASLPFVALGAGAPVVEVNPDVTELSSAVTHRLAGPAGLVLPAVVG